MKYYPALLDLRNKRAIVIGGGSVAERKARSLVKAGADVTIVSPEVTKGLKRLIDQKSLKHTKRAYKKGDVKHAYLVVAATSSPEINKKIAREADCLVNVIDQPSEGNFIVPSIVKQGALTIAVSTEGASPAVSKAIRKEIEGLYGKDYGRYLRYVESLRQSVLSDIRDSKKRKGFLNFLASDNILALLRKKGFRETQGEISKRLADLR